MLKVLVVYYDGNDNRATVCETDTPDSSMPHVFGLSDDIDIVAVVTLEKGEGHIRHDVFIGEAKALTVQWG